MQAVYGQNPAIDLEGSAIELMIRRSDCCVTIDLSWRIGENSLRCLGGRDQPVGQIVLI